MAEPPYFPTASDDCPTFEDNSDWHPLVDGASYLRALDEQLDGLAAGPDTVLIAGLELDPTIDLTGLRPDEPGYTPLSERLVRLAAEGVDVRILVAGKVFASSIRVPTLEGFRDTVRIARQLRECRPAKTSPSAPPPLADRVLVDWSGALLGSNHQKVVVVGRGAEVIAFVGGIDLTADRFDTAQHDQLDLDGERWGWHDAAVAPRGPAAERVWAAYAQRWSEAATLPPRRYVRWPRHMALINPAHPRPAPAAPPAQPALDRPGTAVRVLRSMNTRKVSSAFPWRCRPWDSVPPTGVHEVFETLTAALRAAQRYVYLEDQYLQEEFGGRRRYELYPYLRDAARRGVKVILVGSGVRDPEDPGVRVRPINSTLNKDLRRKLLDPLPPADRANVAVLRLERVTVHAKLVLVDDAFASIGSANMFSRSMGGVDCELTTAVSTTTPLVRDLRVRVWGEHLRVEVTDEVRARLEDVGTALGIWDESWLPNGMSDPWRSIRAGTENAVLQPVT